MTAAGRLRLAVVAVSLALVVLLSVPATVLLASAHGAAMAGPAATTSIAATTQPISSADRTISNTEVEPGGTATVRLEIQFDAEADRLAITENFDPALADVSDPEVSYEDGSGNTFQAFASPANEFVSVTATNVERGTTIVVTYDVTAVEDSGTRHEFSGEVVAGDQTISISGDARVSVVTDTATKEGTGNGDGGKGDGGGNEDSIPGDDEAVEISDRGVYYIGQTLYTDQYDATDDVDLWSGDGTFISDVPVNSDGIVTLNTRIRDPGQYELRSPSGQTIEFQLVHQEYDVSASPTSVVASGPSTKTKLTISSNRANFENVLTSPQLSAQELAQLFPGERGAIEDRDGDGTAESLLVHSQSVEEMVTADLTEFAPGTYRIDFAVADTVASDNVTVTVEPASQGTATFGMASKVVQTELSTVAEIPILLRNTSEATLVLGSRDLNYQVRIEVRDGDDSDSQVTVRWDTALAGQGSSADPAFSAADDADAVTATRETGSFQGSVAATAYPMNLSVDGRETDLGTVSVVEVTGTKVCGRAVTPLIEEYNANVDAIPGFASGIVSGKTIHGVVSGDATGNYTVITGSDKRVADFRSGAPDDASVLVETDCETFRSLADAEDAVDVFRQAYDAGEISVRGDGFFQGFIIEAIKLGLEIAETFGVL